MHQLTAGTRLGEYVLLERLGTGGFGEVWKAEHSELPGKLVAVKVPTNPDYVKQLRAAGVLQRELDHPNIVKTLTLNTAHDPPYMVMEYVPGETLRDVLRREGKLPWERAVKIACDVLEGLEHAHGKGVVHRDLKPENILIGTDGEAHITDFGLGKVTEQVSIKLSFKASVSGRALVGTFDYMSPEQKLGYGPEAYFQIHTRFEEVPHQCGLFCFTPRELRGIYECYTLERQTKKEPGYVEGELFFSFPVNGARCARCRGWGSVKCVDCDVYGIDLRTNATCVQCGGSAATRCTVCDGDGIGAAKSKKTAEVGPMEKQQWVLRESYPSVSGRTRITFELLQGTKIRILMRTGHSRQARRLDVTDPDSEAVLFELKCKLATDQCAHGVHEFEFTVQRTGVHSIVVNEGDVPLEVYEWRK